MNPATIERLKGSAVLPSLPSVALDVLRLAENPYASMGEIADCVKKDAATAAQLIKTANSAFYAQRRSVDSLDFALQLIGLKAAIPLVVSISLNGLREATNTTIDLEMYWRRSVLTSCLSAKLADFAPDVKKEEALLAGLVQDIGILAAVVVYPEEYGSLPPQFWENHNSILTMEEKLCGDNHISMGAWLLESWNFPFEVIDAVKLSHKKPSKEGRDLSWCVSGSSLMADCILREGDSADLWSSVIGVLKADWLDLPETSITQVAIEALELVYEAQSIFNVEILPDEFQSILQEEKAVMA